MIQAVQLFYVFYLISSAFRHWKKVLVVPIESISFFLEIGFDMVKGLFQILNVDLLRHFKGGSDPINCSVYHDLNILNLFRWQLSGLFFEVRPCILDLLQFHLPID